MRQQQTQQTEPISPARKRVLETVKRQSGITSGILAEELQMTDVAVRQHLAALEGLKLVSSTTLPAQGRGRPSIAWAVTPKGDSYFPDSHSELAVDLIQAIRLAAGEETLLKVINTRSKDLAARYARKLDNLQPNTLHQRVEELARLRSAEGYMAEVQVNIEQDRGDGDNANEAAADIYYLIENHCPICDAAKCCVGLCQAELEVFQTALGDQVTIERTEHLLASDSSRRCVYRIHEK